MWWRTADPSVVLSSSHTAVSKVDILHGGRPVHTLAVTGGSVTMDVARPVRSNLSCSLVDPTGQLTRGDVDDLLNPYDCEIAPHRGVRVVSSRTSVTTDYVPNAGFGLQPFGTSGFGGVEATQTITSVVTETDTLAPLGVFQLTSRQVTDSDDGLKVQLTGQDRAMGYQGPMASALAISNGTPTEVAIQKLLSTRQPGLSLATTKTGFVTGPLLFGPDIDVWAEAQKLAESVGARLSHDRMGQAVLAMAGWQSDRPVARYAEGDGRLLSVDRSEDSDTIRNVVVAESADGTVRVEVSDLDPSSPTYSRGRYGRRVFTLKNPYFGSVRQATQAAAARLAYELGRSEKVAFTAVPDPGLDVDDVVTVHRPRLGLVERGVVVATLEVPLAPTEPMRVGCRQSQLAQDGRMLQDPAEVQV